MLGLRSFRSRSSSISSFARSSALLFFLVALIITNYTRRSIPKNQLSQSRSTSSRSLFSRSWEFFCNNSMQRSRSKRKTSPHWLFASRVRGQRRNCDRIYKIQDILVRDISNKVMRDRIVLHSREHRDYRTHTHTRCVNESPKATKLTRPLAKSYCRDGARALIVLKVRACKLSRVQ